jgi:hypothetical protein
MDARLRTSGMTDKAIEFVNNIMSLITYSKLEGTYENRNCYHVQPAFIFGMQWF